MFLPKTFVRVTQNGEIQFCGIDMPDFGSLLVFHLPNWAYKLFTQVWNLAGRAGAALAPAGRALVRGAAPPERSSVAPSGADE